jgi:hypothetical protein
MKNKKLKNLIWVIFLLPILVIFMKIILPDLIERNNKSTKEALLKEKAKNDSLQALYDASQPVPAQAGIYEFNSSGTIVLYLRGLQKYIPKGGKIKIFTPSGDVWEDQPGVIYNRGQNTEGKYTFYKDSGDAWGIEIVDL